MKIDVSPDPQSAAVVAAGYLLSSLATASTIVVAAGNTPIETYRRIAIARRSLLELHVFALDEYLGVPPDDPRTCANLLRAEVAQAWGVADDHFHALPSDEASAPAAIAAHEGRIEKAGLDLIVLGLGRNGHLGFNEPGSAPGSRGRIVELEPISVGANREWFAGDYAPARGVTLGLATLLAARRVVLLAFGSAKAAPVARMVESPPAVDSPASWLQTHRDVTLFIDTAAASMLGEAVRR